MAVSNAAAVHARPQAPPQTHTGGALYNAEMEEFCKYNGTSRECVLYTALQVFSLSEQFMFAWFRCCSRCNS